jgi:glycolate oxidase iron-sulfur subunit
VTPATIPLDKLLACVHCGLCLPSCPTYVETGSEADSPRGRIYLMKALAEEKIRVGDDVVRHLDLCLGCRACETACPSGVEYGALVESARHVVEESAARRPLDRLRRKALARVLPDPRRLRPAAVLLRAASRLGVARLATARWLPLGARRMAALLPPSTPERPLGGVLQPEGPARGTVALLAGCVARVFFSNVNEATARLLALAGYRVVVPPSQVCCGALLAHMGEAREARRLARRNVNAFLAPGETAPDDASHAPDWIVTNAAGCGATLRDYGRLFADDAVFARGGASVAARTRDATELLADALPEPRAAFVSRVAYHDACHLAHGQGVRDAPRALLRRVPGLELVEIPGPELCCGSAGSYSLTEPDMAWRLGERRARAVLETGADVVAAGNPGCILQIRAALRVAGRELPVLHPIEIAARAWGVEPN